MLRYKAWILCLKNHPFFSPFTGLLLTRLDTFAVWTRWNDAVLQYIPVSRTTFVLRGSGSGKGRIGKGSGDCFSQTFPKVWLFPSRTDWAPYWMGSMSSSSPTCSCFITGQDQTDRHPNDSIQTPWWCKCSCWQWETKIQELFLNWSSWLLPDCPDNPTVLFYLHQTAILLCRAILYLRKLFQKEANQKCCVPVNPSVFSHSILKKTTKLSCDGIYAISPQV